MNQKQLKDKIKNNIQIQSKEFLNDLLEYPVEPCKKNKTFKYKFSLQFLMIPLILLIAFVSINLWNNNRLESNNKSQMNNEIFFNKLEYTNKNDDDKLIDSLQIIPDYNNLQDINQLFNIKLYESQFDNFDISNECYKTELSGKLLYCNVSLREKGNDSLKIQIGIQNDGYPLFIDENVDSWQAQQNFDKLKSSKINGAELILIKNTKNNLSNIRTKFMKGNLGIAINSYDIDEEEFIKVVTTVLNG